MRADFSGFITAPADYRTQDNTPRVRFFAFRIAPQPGGCEHQTARHTKALDEIFPKPPFSAVTPSWLWSYTECKKTNTGCLSCCSLYVFFFFFGHSRYLFELTLRKEETASSSQLAMYRTLAHTRARNANFSPRGYLSAHSSTLTAFATSTACPNRSNCWNLIPASAMRLSFSLRFLATT